MNKIFKGIRFRLTLVYSTLFGLFICAFAYIITYQYLDSGREDFDSGLLNYAIDLSEHLRIDQSSLKIDFALPASEIRKAFPFIIHDTYYTVRNYEGKILTKSSKDLPFLEIPYDPKLPLKHDYTHRFLTFHLNDNTYRAVNLKISNDLGREMILQVATPIDTLEERERTHIFLTTLMVPILIISSSFISFLIAGNALSPIKDLTDAANNIAVKNLSLRVPEVNTGDEVEELSKTLNNLLDRLETAFKGQENFVANASHQLNTPLAIIKGELDVLESKPRTLEEHNRYLKSLREELTRMIELVKNMLLVSRVESGLENFVFNPVRIDDLILTIITRLTPKAREKKINIRFNLDEDLEDFEVMGERQLLDSLFENILENALKYSPEASHVLLEIKKHEGKMEVQICDEGPGMTPEDFQKIISSRFQRGAGISIPGSGIGLSIASKIAEYHQAKIIYQRLNPGSLFIVRFN